MTPALGSQSPEIRHLNLKWSMGDVYRIVALAKDGWNAVRIARSFTDAGMLCQPREIVEICQSMNRHIRFSDMKEHA